MRLIGTTKDKLTFQFGKREKLSLVQILNLYPRIPPAHQPLSRSRQLPDLEACQQLLNEALAEQRAENKQQLERLLHGRFEENQSGWQLALSPGDVEWLLQILNDIRVGSWLLLGAPEAKFEVLNAKTAPDLVAMQMAGHFQMEFLEAMRMS